MQEIATLEKTSDAATQLSNPAFHTNLPFPFIGRTLPNRFKMDKTQKWFYMGREKFVELLNSLDDEEWGINRSALWVYGTKGYGKSHILAALICYLSAKGMRVIYIPDCRECIKDPVEYFRTAMLFAWADDNKMQKLIITLDTLDKIHNFFNFSKKPRTSYLSLIK